ncbi:methyltransferase family protein [Actinopolyspora halophila]|uniref:methyltransferase family protein n=1 Tax=Actinopolyspora halophila TaxID=1850 RepID=UPI00037A87B9|nr:methyltransferase [Actinopolyspora halophila]
MIRPARRRGRAAAAAAVHTLSGVLLLRRMRRELLTTGRLSAPTVAWMYATYTTHAAASAWLLTRDRAPTEHPRLARCLRWIGAVLALSGSGLYTVGANRFAGPGQLSGTQVGNQVSSGVYRYSRHPQYTGLVLTLCGLALARRSPAAAALAAAAAAAYRWWAPVEEAHLEATFGEDYRSYRARTPRWLGPPTVPHASPPTTVSAGGHSPANGGRWKV